MGITLARRWILALLMLAVVAIALSQTVLQNFAALLWFTSLGLMIAALGLAVIDARRTGRPHDRTQH